MVNQVLLNVNIQLDKAILLGVEGTRYEKMVCPDNP